MTLFKNKFSHIKQPDSMECGATCLRMVARHYGKIYSAEYMRCLCAVSHSGVSMQSMNEAAKSIGFQTVCGRMTQSKLIEQRPFPCILHWQQEHFVVLYDVKVKRNGKTFFYIADPGKCLLKVEEESFLKAWTGKEEDKEGKGILMALRPTDEFYRQQEETGAGHSLSFLWGYVKHYRKLFVQLLLGVFIGSVLQLLFPFLTQAIVDKGIEGKNLHLIYLILLGQLMLVTGRTFIEFIRRWLLLHISSRINISLLSDFFLKLMKLPMSFFDTKLKGDLLQRMQDHHRLEQFMTAQTLMTLFSVFTFFIFGGVLLYYNAWIFLIFLVGSVLYGLWVCIFLQKRKAIDYEFFDLQSRSHNKAMQILDGMQDIKLQNSEHRERWEWEDAQADLFHTTIASTKLQQNQEAGSLLINEIKNVIITVTTATLVINGELTLGMMLSIQYIVGQLNVPIGQLVRFIYSWQDVQISIERINEIHHKKDENMERNIHSIHLQADIEIKNLTFQYNGTYSQKALDDVSLHIPYGKTTAIVGASGSGKTTLIKLLLGFYSPVSGHIRIGNQDLQDINLDYWRSLCGVVMQDGYIFSESIARNIAFNNHEIDEEKVMEAARLANVTEIAEQLPLKYHTTIGANGQGLSQGQRQRILIARAIYKNPHFLFFDEATNSLDANNEKRITDNLEEFAKEKTMVVVAHRLSTVRNADQIIVLEKGKIVETGNHDELITKKGVYYQLIKNQLELGE